MRTRLAVLSCIVLVVAATAGPAGAHVTIPDPGEAGGFSIVTFSVPNERPDASTTTFEVQLPQDHPLTFVSVQPKPGWTVATTMRTLTEPVEAFGEPVTEVVDTVMWSGGTIGPGEFDTFGLSVGVLPEGVDSLTFPAIQTYSSGEEVAWIEETPATGEEPEHPAPVLRLVAAGAGGDHEAAADDPGVAGTSGTADDGVDGVAVAALVVAVLAAVLGGAALAAARRRPTS